MPKLRDMDVRAVAMQTALDSFNEAINDTTFKTSLENAGQNAFAFKTEVDIEGKGELTEVWVEFKATVKTWKPHSVKGTEHPAYCPFTVEQEWQDTLQDRERKAKERADKKAKQIAKSQKAKGG